MKSNLHVSKSHNGNKLGAIAFSVVCALGIGGFSLGGISLSDSVVSADLWRNLPTAPATRRQFNKTVEVVAEVRPYQPVLVEAECYLRCNILEMIPEGTNVKKGDVVMRLDSAELEERMKDRELRLIRYRNLVDRAVAAEQLLAATNERKLSQARMRVQTARDQLSKWEQAEYQQTLKELNDDVSLSRESFLAVKDDFEYTRTLATQGVRPWQDVDRASSRMQQAKRKLELAKGSRYLLQEFESRRSKASLTAAVTIANNTVIRTELSNSRAVTTAKLLTMRYSRSMKIYEESYERYKNAFESCVVKATCDGEVAYANSWTRRSMDTARIEVGSEIRNGWDLFYLIDRRQMKLRGRVSDRFANQLAEGQPVEFNPDANDKNATPWNAHVAWVSPISFARSRYTPHLRDHWYEILIDEPHQKIATGLSPRQDITATIKVDVRPNVLQIPVAALMEHNGDTVVLVKTLNGARRRLVTIGAVTDESAEITDGLSEGEEVYIAPTEDLRSLAETL